MTHPVCQVRDIFLLPYGGSKGMVVLAQTPVMGAAHLCIQICEKICLVQGPVIIAQGSGQGSVLCCPMCILTATAWMEKTEDSMGVPMWRVLCVLWMHPCGHGILTSGVKTTILCKMPAAVDLGLSFLNVFLLTDCFR